MADSKKYNGSQWEHSLRKLTTATETVENPLYSDGTAITSYTIKGNTLQNGTPTPSNPVEVQGVGEKTENLFDVNHIIDGGDFYISVATGGASAKMSSSANTDILLIPCQPNTTYTVSRQVITKRFVIGFLPSVEIYENMPVPSFAYNDAATELTATSANDSHYLCVYYAKHAGSDRDTEEVIQACLDTLMVNEGSTALPYEPYGYKIPISSGDVTTNIYLGSTQTVRQVKKLVLTGQESWNVHDTIASCFYIDDLFIPVLPTDIKSNIDIICSHYIVVPYKKANDGTLISGESTVGHPGSSSINRFIIKDTNHTTVADFQTYLQQQYANCAPVTVWYVLATAETAAVNEPLMKIGTYVDTLSNATAIATTEGANTIAVDTTVQPSEFTATWTGWHNTNVKEWDGTEWQ